MSRNQTDFIHSDVLEIKHHQVGSTSILISYSSTNLKDSKDHVTQCICVCLFYCACTFEI